MMKKSVLIIVIPVIVIIAAAVYLLFFRRGKTDIVAGDGVRALTVTSPSFTNLGVMPDIHTGRGEDISPAIVLSELDESVESLAVIMEDLDIPIPWLSSLTHWVIWNIPPVQMIPENIPHGAHITAPFGAAQGTAYGNHRYRGPLPPFGTHRYVFHVFALDTMLDLPEASGKKELVAAMEGHIVQYGSITGWYPREGK